MFLMFRNVSIRISMYGGEGLIKNPKQRKGKPISKAWFAREAGVPASTMNLLVKVLEKYVK